MSLPRLIGAFFGALAILLGIIVVAGWTFHSSVLVRVDPAFFPTQQDTAVGFVLSGLALLGIVWERPRVTFACATITAILAAASLLEKLFHAHFGIDEFAGTMSRGTALCFMVLACGIVLAQISPFSKRPPILGAAGLLVGTVAAACGISLVWGTGNAFGLGNFTRMAFPTTAGFLLLGTGAVAMALDLSQAGLRQPLWLSIGAAIFLATVRIGLLRAFSPEHQTAMSSALSWLGALLGAVVFGVFVHLALKAHLQRELLRRAEQATLAANEQLEQGVEERTKALEAANAELREEIALRQRVEQDLRQQKEILQSIFDHIPVMVSFIDRDQHVRLVNREWEKTLGWSLEEIQGQDIDRIVVEHYPDAGDLERARDFVGNSEAEWVDFKTKVRDGRMVDTSWAILHLSDGTGIGIGQDISARKEAERELRRQKEILQTIFDHLPLMVGFVDRQGQAQVVNREWERTLGWTLEEIRSQNIDVIEENYPDPEYRAKVRDFVANSDAEWADFKTMVRDGRLIDTSWVMLRLSDGTGIGIGQDITKRKRAEEELKESEERFRQLAENIHDLFWIKTPDFKRVLYLSPAYESITGYPPEDRYQEPDYQPFLDRIVPEDRERVAEIMRRGAREEFEIDFRIRRPDGRISWIRDRGFPIRDQSGQVYRIAGIASDITERKLAEDALREGEERFRQLTENIREVFWITTADFGRQVYISPGFENLTGHPPETLYSGEGHKPFLHFVHPDDLPLLREVTSDSKREFDVEYRVIRADGSVRWVRDRGFPIRNQSGQIYRFGGVAEDITARKETEERLKATSEQLRALSASLQSAREKEATRIARQIHDDMGGILTGLRWELEALEKMIQELSDPWHLRLVIQNKLASMMGLTDTTLNVVRRIASELRPSILDDLGLMEAIEWQTQQFQARTGIQCCCDCSLQSIALPDQESTAVFRILQEALTNILRHAQASHVRVAIREQNGSLVLTVADNGRGITEAEKCSRQSLGLLGMQERANLIGGCVDIVGTPGTGTTLHIRVPLSKSEQVGAI